MRHAHRSHSHRSSHRRSRRPLQLAPPSRSAKPDGRGLQRRFPRPRAAASGPPRLHRARRADRGHHTSRTCAGARPHDRDHGRGACGTAGRAADADPVAPTDRSPRRGPGWRGPGAAGPDESPRRRPPRATRRTSETPRSPTRPGGTMRRTDIIVDPRAPGSRRRGQLRPIGPIIERFIAQASVRSEAAEKPQRRRAA